MKKVPRDKVGESKTRDRLSLLLKGGVASLKSEATDADVDGGADHVVRPNLLPSPHPPTPHLAPLDREQTSALNQPVHSSSHASNNPSSSASSTCLLLRDPRR